MSKNHENWNRKPKLQAGSSRKFGLFFALVFFVTSLFLYRKTQQVNPYFVLLTILFLTAAAAYPKSLDLLNRLWFQLGLFLSRLTTPIIWTLLYFVVVTPLGFILKKTGRLSFDKKPDTSQTFWLERKSKTLNKDSFSRQF
jgi:hypothetical protein